MSGGAGLGSEVRGQGGGREARSGPQQGQHQDMEKTPSALNTHTLTHTLT